MIQSVTGNCSSKTDYIALQYCKTNYSQDKTLESTVVKLGMSKHREFHYLRLDIKRKREKPLSIVTINPLREGKNLKELNV